MGAGKATGRACRLKREQNGGLCDEQNGALNQNASVSVCVCLCVCEKEEGGREEEGIKRRGRENKQENKRTYVSLKAFRNQQGQRDLILGMSSSLDLKTKKGWQVLVTFWGKQNIEQRRGIQLNIHNPAAVTLAQGRPPSQAIP